MILEVSNAAYVYFLITFVSTKVKQKNNNEDSQAQKVSRTAFLKDLKIAQDIADTVDACPGIRCSKWGRAWVS